MRTEIPFTKMHGIGNDYVYINGFEVTVDDPERLARHISDRHFGVGSDGLILILPSESGDVRMRMFNSDGSEAEMCGNAVRCVGKYAHDHGLARGSVVRVETRSGEKAVRLLFEHGEVTGATVDMGEPVLTPALVPVIPDAQHQGAERLVDVPIHVQGQEFRFTAVSMGNPHAIIFMKDVDKLDLPHLGPQFEHHPMFPQRTNTEFVDVTSPTSVNMRVWERGAGETLACGTGSCATVVACVLNGLTERRVGVHLLGGKLDILWDADNNHVFMTGGATTVFDGVYLYEGE